MRQWIMVLATAWFLWGQDEKVWFSELLNFIPGPSRGNPYIVSEFESQSACMEAWTKKVLAKGDARLKTPPMRKSFGDSWTDDFYACVPAPLKPERIDRGGSWK
jgi:hypothetical protein